MALLALGMWASQSCAAGSAPEPSATADPEHETAPPPAPASSESWFGAEATANVWSIYSGLTWAPLGSVREDGWRVRLASGYGQYRYRTSIDGERQQVHGTAGFADLLVGYHVTTGDLTVKAFAGANFDGHALTPFDPGNPVADRMIGAKAALETWLTLGANDWAALDLSYSVAHASYYSRLRLGHRILPDVSIGLEGGAYGNRASDNARGGGFLRYAWDGGEISASGGVSGDIAKPTTPYATLVYLSRF